MYQVVAAFLLLAVVGCASTQGSKESLDSNRSYLGDLEFIDAYLSFIQADSRYLRAFSAESKKALVTASQALKAYADSGNPIAQLSYGTSQYLVDRQVNAPVFKYMLQKSASSGYLPATRKLAQFYRSGRHFGKQESKALEILESNAAYGHERDLETLLALYKRLPSISVNAEKHVELEKKLELSRDIEYLNTHAKNGNLYAQRLYGHMLYHGKKIEKDYFNAAIWLSVAAKNKANTQAAYDSARAIYALSKLTDSEIVEVDEHVSRFDVIGSEK